MSSQVPRPVVLLRIVVALLLAIHGFYRGMAGGVAPFGGFLSEVGLPFGTGVAWLITIFEMASPLLLAAGRWVRWLCAGHSLILAGGIALVHAREGWFVVGGGRNGVEYSVLLLVSLLVIAWAHGPWAGRS